MSLDDVAKSVVQKGKVEADKIVKEGGKEVLLILSNADKEIKALIDEQSQRAKKDIALKREQELSSAEVEARRKILMAEKEVLEQVKNRTFERMVAAPRNGKENMLKKLVSSAATVIPSGTIYSNTEDADFVKRHGSPYSFGGTVQCAGGIIVENPDRTERLDLTYETILEDVWQEQIGKVAEVLFR